MKCVAAIAAVIGLAVTVPASAQSYGLDPPLVAAMPPAEIVTIVRSMGFLPISRPVLRGNVYILRAADDDDLPVRVMVDARSVPRGCWGRAMAACRMTSMTRSVGRSRIAASPRHRPM
jgi:hypothetical protein